MLSFFVLVHCYYSMNNNIYFIIVSVILILKVGIFFAFLYKSYKVYLTTK